MPHARARQPAGTSRDSRATLQIHQRDAAPAWRDLILGHERLPSQIDGNGCQPLAWTASITGVALTLSTTSGVTPAALPISADVQGLPADAHMLGSVTVTGANGAGVATRQVRMVILEALYHSSLPVIRR